MAQHAVSDTPRTVERGPLSAVCADVSALVRRRWGRGPRRSRADWAGPDTLLVTLDDVHTEAERTLADHGRADEVLAGRRLLCDLAAADLRRIGESATGRPVRAVLSQTSLEPALTVHVFHFEPLPRGKEDDRLGSALRRALDETDSARALIAEGEQMLHHTAERRAARETRGDARDEARGQAPEARGYGPPHAGG